MSPDSRWSLAGNCPPDTYPKVPINPLKSGMRVIRPIGSKVMSQRGPFAPRAVIALGFILFVGDCTWERPYL
jgi:hypothetical protein